MAHLASSKGFALVDIEHLYAAPHDYVHFLAATRTNQRLFKAPVHFGFLHSTTACVMYIHLPHFQHW
jgi:hypothetical protein